VGYFSDRRIDLGNKSIVLVLQYSVNSDRVVFFLKLVISPVETPLDRLFHLDSILLSDLLRAPFASIAWNDSEHSSEKESVSTSLPG
jgi:hypothetical protein